MTAATAERAMATIGLTVGVAAAVAPTQLQRVFGVPSSQITASGHFGWRLFAMRNLYLSGLALAGERSAIAAFLPVQLLDQVVFWQAFATRSVPRRTSTRAAAASGVIIGVDLVRRRGDSRNDWLWTRTRCSRPPGAGRSARNVDGLTTP